MKVLLIHQYFKTPESGGALRSYYLSKALVEAGIETVVITTHNSSIFKKEIVEGIEVHYLPVLYDNSFGFVKRVRSFLNFVWSIVREAGQFKDADVCYAISTPLTTGIAALWIKRRYKIPYLFEVGDLWPEAPIQLGIVRNPILKSFLRWLERRIYIGAHEIVGLSESIKTEILKSAPGKRIHVIPNMADTDFFMPAEKNQQLEKQFKVEGKFVISYIGTFGLANGLDNLLDCARKALDEKVPIHFLLCGEGAMLGQLQSRVQRESIDNVSFIPFQNRNGVRDILNVTDAIFVSFQPVPVLQTGSPNKYFDGLAAGKLVIVNFAGWMKSEIENEGCGFTFGTAEEFISLVKPYLDNDSLLMKTTLASRQLAERKYARNVLSREFTNIFSRLTLVDH